MSLKGDFIRIGRIWETFSVSRQPNDLIYSEAGWAVKNVVGPSTAHKGGNGRFVWEKVQPECIIRKTLLVNWIDIWEGRERFRPGITLTLKRSSTSSNLLGQLRVFFRKKVMMMTKQIGKE